MNRYEGMYVFAEAVRNDDVDDAISAARSEIEALGGEVESSTRLGKKSFARILQKQAAGQYAVIQFRMNPQDLDRLRAKNNLAENILRVQVIRMNDRTPPVAKPAEVAS